MEKNEIEKEKRIEKELSRIQLRQNTEIKAMELRIESHKNQLLREKSNKNFNSRFYKTLNLIIVEIFFAMEFIFHIFFFNFRTQDYLFNKIIFRLIRYMD